MNKIKLILKIDYNTSEILKFNSLDELFLFINELAVERLIDSNSTEMHYRIAVEE